MSNRRTPRVRPTRVVGNKLVQPERPNRHVTTFQMSIGPAGLTPNEMADTLKYTAELVRHGYYQGDVMHDSNADGSWSTTEAD